MNVIFERGSAQDPLAQSSLYCVERRFYAKNRRASCILYYDVVYNDSFVLNDPEQNVFESHVSWCNGLKDIAVTIHRPASADDGSLLFWASFFTTVKDRASSTTSPIRWEAYLPWMSHDPVSPVWGYSMYSQIVGKLGYCIGLLFVSKFVWAYQVNT